MYIDTIQDLKISNIYIFLLLLVWKIHENLKLYTANKYNI